MSYEQQVKRTIYVAECGKCGDRNIKEDNPPKARLCKCGEWVPYKEESYTGPSLQSQVA
jgi:hypothetical protein